MWDRVFVLYIYNLDGNAFVLICFWRCDCESGEKEEKKPERRRKKEKKKKKEKGKRKKRRR